MSTTNTVSLQDHFAEFLTIPAYEHLIATNVSKE